MAIVTELELPGLGPDGPAELGGVEGIYGVESLPLPWSAGCPPGTPLAGRFPWAPAYPGSHANPHKRSVNTRIRR
jgi:hypothetical protein